MLQHLADHIDITAGCVVRILELDHIGQFLIRRYTDDLFSGALRGFHSADLILIYASEHVSGVRYLGYQIRIVIYKSSLFLYIGIQRVSLFFKRCFQCICRSLILGAVRQTEAQFGGFLHES